MERLSKKEKGFADDYLETGNGTQSAINNYDTEDRDVAGVIASQNLRKLRIIEYLESNAESAISRIVDLSMTAENEAVKLSANKDIVDRAGFKPIERNVNLNIETKHIEGSKEKAKAFDEWYKNQL